MKFNIVQTEFRLVLEATFTNNPKKYIARIFIEVKFKDTRELIEG